MIERLWIDASPLLPPRTGIGRYCAGLLQGFAALQAESIPLPVVELLHADGSLQSAETAWTITSGRHWAEASTAPMAPWRWRLLAMLRRAGRHVPGLHTLNDRWRDLRVEKRLRQRVGMDRVVLHATNFIPPISPKRWPGSLALTVHDMSCFDVPETHPLERVRRMQRRLPAAVKTADTVFCVSQHAASRLQHHLGVPQHKIRVTPLGVDAFFFDEKLQQQREVLACHGLQAGRYWLSVATLEPRKNLELVIRTFGRLPQRERLTTPLVLVGALGWKTGPLQRVMEPLVREGSVRVLGYLPDTQLPALYAQACAVIYLSRYEGFGLPVAEAMACGALVIASNATSIPEVLADAGISLHPDDEDGLLALFRTIPATCASGYVDLREQARAVARANFTWKRCAETTLAGYALKLSDAMEDAIQRSHSS